MQVTNASTASPFNPALFSTEPEHRIYVASLSDYNNGILHGVWIDAEQDSDEIQDAINAMLANSPTAQRTGQTAEEWAIHAYEGFCGIRLDENEDLDTVSDLANALDEHGEVFARFYDYSASGTDVQTCIEQFESAYHGTFDNIRAFAEQYAEDIDLLGSVPDHLRYYFDLESWAQDLELNGDITTIDVSDGIAVFGHY